jgi:hypothetical protein
MVVQIDEGVLREGRRGHPQLVDIDIGRWVSW